MKIGYKVQQWQEKMNREFNGTLLPAPLIRIEETKVLTSRHVSDGQTRVEKITIRIQQGIAMKHVDIYVQRFDSGNSQRCTWPGCNKTREYSLPWLTNNAGNEILYLCRFHRKRMENYFTKMCADNGVVINRSRSCSSGDFNGYAALIELFEGAIRKTSSILQGGNSDALQESRLLQDTFLNVRNFLIIMNAMIKPNEELLNSILPFIMGITLEVLKLWGQHSIINLVGFMRYFIEYVLFFFGIMNPWESLFPDTKPYVQIGSGVGGMLGVLLSLCAIGPLSGLAAMGAGSLCGAVFGAQYYIYEQRRQMLGESYCRYLDFRHLQQNYQDIDNEDYNEDLNYLSGSAYIDSLLAVMLTIQAISLLTYF
jgi:hypothetical protein